MMNSFVLGLSVATALLTPLLCAAEFPLPAEPPFWVENPMPASTTSGTRVSAAGLPLYSIGSPSDDEQLYLELINRARANPAAEAARYVNTTDSFVLGAYQQFGVDTALMRTLISAYAPQPPLSLNAKLSAAALAHSQDMLANQWQNHGGSDGSTALTRVQATGYSPTTVAENIYSFAENTPQGHAGFEVDWGDQGAIGIGGVTAIIGGMQTPAGHRNNIHSGVYREIGIGVINTNRTKVGPQLVTQDFGTEAGAKPFITGVAFYDLNHDQFYGLGEGAGGISVNVSGANFAAVTSTSGGYSIPVSGNGTYTVTFSVPGAAPVVKTVTVAELANAKVDLVMDYAGPAIIGPQAPGIGVPNAYEISTIFGATAYEWSVAQLATATSIGAEDNVGSVIPAISSKYALISTAVKGAGTASYHLLNPDASPQWFDLKGSYFVGPQGSIDFLSRLGGAASDQTARVQVSKDDGVNWTSLYNQVGTDSFGENNFTRRNINLASLAGQRLKFRFLFDFSAGSYAEALESDYGWYLDDIRFSDVQAVVSERVDRITTPSFSFTPSAQTKYLLRARPVLAGRPFDWGNSLVAQAANVVAGATTKVKSIGLNATGSLQIEFEIVSGAGNSFAIETASAVKGAWTIEPAATISSPTAGTFRAILSKPAGTKFFRVRGN